MSLISIVTPNPFVPHLQFSHCAIRSANTQIPPYSSSYSSKERHDTRTSVLFSTEAESKLGMSEETVE